MGLMRRVGRVWSIPLSRYLLVDYLIGRISGIQLSPDGKVSHFLCIIGMVPRCLDLVVLASPVSFHLPNLERPRRIR
jgi:hypothetical protein